MDPTTYPSALSRPSPGDSAEHTLLLVGGVGMIVAALFLLSCAFFSGLLYLILPFASQSAVSDTASNVVSGSITGLGIAFGVLLAWQGSEIVRRRDSRPAAHSFPSLVLLVLAFVTAVLLGTGMLGLKRVSAFLFPPWHFIAASMPPLAFVAYAARRLGGTSGLRALVTAVSWGALGATPLAMLIEVAIGLVVVLVAAIAIVSSPGSKAVIDQMQGELLRTRGTFDPAVAARWLANPIVILIGLFYFCGIVPLVEEALKTLVVAFVDPRRTTRANALLWAISASAGFALVENVLNSGAVLTVWALAMVMRVGATTVHIANGVTMGRGWYAARVEGRWNRLIVAFGASVLFHALWNAAALALSGGLLFAENTPPAAAEWPVPLNVLFSALAGGLIVLALFGLVWTISSVRSASVSALSSQTGGG